MESLVSLVSISKAYGVKSLFEGLSLSFFKGDSTALIGRNGSGKSSLLKIIAGIESVDSGSVIRKKNLHLEYVGQSPSFPENHTVSKIIEDHLRSLGVSEEEITYLPAIALSTCEFSDFQVKVSELSGGWIKRLAIAKAIAKEPDFLLLDEPTNHMDWESISWLLQLLKQKNYSLLVVSHDRYFLNQIGKKTIEIGPAFENGYLSFSENYESYLNSREAYMEAQAKQVESLSNKARRELEWLRAGVKARTTKSQSRIQEAHKLLEHLESAKSRGRVGQSKLNLEIESSERKTKKLIEFKTVSKSYGAKKLFAELSFVISPKTCLAIVGENGSGKTSLVKILMEEVLPDSGSIFRAENLQVVYFDQHKTQLDLNLSIFEFLGEGSDHLSFQGKSIHVASYAQRFLFDSNHYHLKISQLSGGERARLQLAKIFLKPCDVLIFDEPTNDLDIESLEVLENLICDLEAAVVLISHDRKFVENTATHFLALEGAGNWNFYADLEQSLQTFHKAKSPPLSLNTPPSVSKEKKRPNAKLSNKERQELANMETDIQDLEIQLENSQKELSSPEVASNHEKLLEITQKISHLQKDIDTKYERWELLSNKVDQS